MKTETLKSIVNAFKCASKDPTRIHIQHVLLTAKGDQVTIRATNGALISRVILADPELAQVIRDRRIMVSPENLAALKVILKDYKNLPGLCERSDEKGIILEAQLSRFEVTLQTEKESSLKFPDVDHLEPTYPDEAPVVSFDPAKLLALFEGMKQEKRTIAVKMTFNQSGPILVSVDGQSGLLMPCRM